ncbi:helix-turn-helix domain-containing protein [Ruthenibacterium lactatiformans]|uniref:helix-turn-helix domain-containing protein n=1 Tax=Ruthenibacterium lactatiformans TaxID=1550024 RepID=UPI003AEF5A0D
MFDFTRFNDLAKRKGITKLYIATQIGRHQSIFNDWSKGKSVPKPEHLRQVATLLDTTPEYLTGESDDSGLLPEPPEKQKKLLTEASSLSDAELEKALEYIQFLKSQRKK